MPPVSRCQGPEAWYARQPPLRGPYVLGRKGRDRKAELRHTGGVAAVMAAGFAVPAGLLEREHHAEVGALVPRVLGQDVEVMPDRGVVVARRGRDLSEGSDDPDVGRARLLTQIACPILVGVLLEEVPGIYRRCRGQHRCRLVGLPVAAQ